MFHFVLNLFYVSHVVFNKRNTGQTPYKLAIVVNMVGDSSQTRIKVWYVSCFF